MTFFTDMSRMVDRLADGYISRVLAEQEAEIQSVLDDAHLSGAMRGEVGVVLVFRVGQYRRIQVRLA